VEQICFILVKISFSSESLLTEEIEWSQTIGISTIDASLEAITFLTTGLELIKLLSLHDEHSDELLVSKFGCSVEADILHFICVSHKIVSDLIGCATVIILRRMGIPYKFVTVWIEVFLWLSK
jgi:hypothetical protein